MRHAEEPFGDVAAHARGLEALRRWSGQARTARQRMGSTTTFGTPIASTAEAAPGIPVVALAGIVDAYTAAGLSDDLLRAAAGSLHLVVDLAEVTLLDSCGLSALLAACLGLRKRGGALAIVAGRPQVMHGFELCGLDRLLHVEPTRAAALEALGATSATIAPTRGG